MKQKFNVGGMTCASCSAHVEKAVGKLDGVSSVSVNLLAKNMTVEYDADVLSADGIMKAVSDAGYQASLDDGSGAKVQSPSKTADAWDEAGALRRRFWTSLCFLVPLMYLSMYHMFNEWFGLPIPGFMHDLFHGPENAVTFALTQLILVCPILLVNQKYFTTGFKTLFKRSPNMDTLIALGSSAAVLYGLFALYRIGWGLGHGDMALVESYGMDIYFESAGTILTLITLGKYLEAKSKGRTGDAIARLMDLSPKTATVVRDGQELEIPVGEVLQGDVVLVRPGQSIPVDGEILEGSSTVDQSALTGESIPVEKAKGDHVIAASVNKAGFLKLRALRVGDDTTLSQIIRLVEEAGSSKAPIARLADKISGIFVPVVLCIAVATAVIWMLAGQTFEFALSTGIAVLVISCPCALGLATPVAIMVSTGVGAQNGILIKSAQSLETAHKIDTVVLDKTGTVTEGKPRVTDLLPADGVDASGLLRLAASLEEPSEHPLAEAIVEAAKQQDVPLYAVEEFEAVSGRGIRALVEGKSCFAGNVQWMRENQIDTGAWEQRGDLLAENGKTPLYFARGGQLLGIIAVADVVKATSRQAIDLMRSMHIDVVMLTGDHQKTAEAIRRQMNIDRVVAEVLPQDKEQEIRRLQEAGKKVAMVGDGINDAPALARADVGIAIGAGTDVAIESADIVLMKSDLLDVVTAIRLSHAVIRNIKMNLFWAFFYNSLGIPLAAGVFFPAFGLKLDPMFAAAAMSLSSVCVVLNALRLKLFKPGFAVETSAPVPDTIPTIEEEDNLMKKIIHVDGMSCAHCQASVEKALSALDGVADAKVDLKKKTATVTLSADVADDALKAAVTDAGFTPGDVTEKKGLFAR
ncbi:MAG: heavy metal translocating P-type ATPase [Clostridiales bacterium]|nr:heavy metal translocating P-type ATPase [Clostridiales bacterium]